MTRLAAALAIALLGLACGPSERQVLEPPVLRLVLAGHDNVEPLPVTVLDAAGIVRALVDEDLPVEGDAALDLSVRTVVGRPDILVVQWLGGMCDKEVRIDVVPRSGDRDLDIRVTTAVRLGGCRLAGIGRRVALIMGAAVESGRVGLTEHTVVPGT